MKLVDDIRHAWKWFSVQAMAASAAVQAVWVGLPPDLKNHFPATIVTALSVGLLVVGIVGRLIKQDHKDDGHP